MGYKRCYYWRQEKHRSTHFAPLGHGWFCVGCFVKNKKQGKKQLNVSQYRRNYSGMLCRRLYQYSLIQRSETLMFHWKKNLLKPDWILPLPPYSNRYTSRMIDGANTRPWCPLIGPHTGQQRDFKLELSSDWPRHPSIIKCRGLFVFSVQPSAETRQKLSSNVSFFPLKRQSSAFLSLNHTRISIPVIIYVQNKPPRCLNMAPVRAESERIGSRFERGVCSSGQGFVF